MLSGSAVYRPDGRVEIVEEEEAEEEDPENIVDPSPVIPPI